MSSTCSLPTPGLLVLTGMRTYPSSPCFWSPNGTGTALGTVHAFTRSTRRELLSARPFYRCWQRGPERPSSLLEVTQLGRGRTRIRTLGSGSRVPAPTRTSQRPLAHVGLASVRASLTPWATLHCPCAPAHAASCTRNVLLVPSHLVRCWDPFVCLSPPDQELPKVQDPMGCVSQAWAPHGACAVERREVSGAETPGPRLPGVSLWTGSAAAPPQRTTGSPEQEPRAPGRKDTRLGGGGRWFSSHECAVPTAPEK